MLFLGTGLIGLAESNSLKSNTL